MQAGIKTAGRNISSLRYADDTTLMAESEEELKKSLDESERGEWKAGLKLNIKKTKTMASDPITLWKIDGRKWKQWLILFSWTPKSLWTVTAAMKLKDTCSLEGKLCKPRQHIKKQRHHFANKGPYSHSYGFSSSHVWMWGLDHIEGWMPKNWCFQTVVLEKTLEFPGLQGDQTSQS